MAFAATPPGRRTAPLAEINMVPLIDVMLVLLVIFIVTAPLLAPAVKLQLPRLAAAPDTAPAVRIELSIDAAGQRHWNGEPVTRDDAAARLRAAGAQQPAPELRLRADHRVPYGPVAETLSDAAQAGLTRIGFVSAPPPR